jgi:hypothetical protein
MKKRTRFWVSLALGSAILLVYYAPLLAKGYVKTLFFPLMLTTTDLPHCPSCDHLQMHLPLVEIAFLTAIFYVLFSAYAWFRTCNNASQVGKESSD